jgi:hypothetical protein
VCCACLLLGGKVDNRSLILSLLIKMASHISSKALPPYAPGTETLARGHAPTVDDVTEYERRALAAVQFNIAIAAAQPVTLLNTVLKQDDWGPRLQLQVEALLQSRAYTDCDLCLQDTVPLVLAAAVVYLQLVSRHMADDEDDGDQQEIQLPDDVTAT